MDTARLRELRAGRRVSLETLGKVIGKSTVSYGKKERGEVPFKPSEVIALSKFYGLTYDEMNAIFMTATYRLVILRTLTESSQASVSARFSVAKKE